MEVPEMTTHDLDKVIAAAKESLAYISGPVPRWIESFYAIAFEAGRVAEREECISIVESYKVSVGNSRAGELACEWTMENLREIRDAIRARSTKAP
jgi:hypothetical protein